MTHDFIGKRVLVTCPSHGIGYAVAEDDLLEEIMNGQTIGGLMVPPDVTSPYLCLASEAAANVTGQALSVDRGEVMA